MRTGKFASGFLGKGADALARLTSFAARPGWLRAVTPTADIYFLNAMGDLVSAGGSVTALGPNVYGANGRYVILRYASDAELASLESTRLNRVFYVIDDDIEALSRSGELPAGYRSRLAAFAAHSLPRIRGLADTVLAPNALLLSRFPEHNTGLLAPSYCLTCDDFAHFDDGSPVRLLFTGTRSHAADLQIVASALERLCKAYPEIELTTFLGTGAPAQLRRLRNVVNRVPLSWISYRRFMAAARFHIALAPFRRTATNECRSHNKVHDHAAFGAAGLYGDIGPYREIISQGRDGLILAAEPQAWFDQLEKLIHDRTSAQRLAKAGVALSQRIGNPSELRAFWCEQLGVRG